jgi:transposase
LTFSENIEDLRILLARVLEENLAFKAELSSARQELSSVKNELSFFKDENIRLKARIKELEAQLNANSHNSSKPPSTDGYKKKPALPKPQKGIKGGQTGHKGDTLKQISNPDKIIVSPLCKCSHCGSDLSKIKGVLSEARQLFDLPEPRLFVTEFRNQRGICPDCGKLQFSEFPTEIHAPVQYGNGVKALVTLLNTEYKVPYKKVHRLFADLFGYPINESTIITANEICYKNLKITEQNIIEQILQCVSAHFDETGMQVAGHLTWFHTAATSAMTYIWVHSKRGKEALNSPKSIIPRFSGWAIHDCWSSYFSYKKARHAVCGAHLLRELEALIEDASFWAKEFQDFLLKVFLFRKENPDISKSEWMQEYDALCVKADLEEPQPEISVKKGRKKRTKGRNLLKRLTEKKDAVLAFAYHAEVPFTNNQAERDIRPIKLKQKISGCFRTFYGAEIYARISGYVSTLRKNQFNIFKELSNVFSMSNFDFHLAT